MRNALLRGIVRSPLGELLGLELLEASPDEVRVRLPYRDELTTAGNIVHGGALSTLVDTSATAAAWAGVEDPGAARGTTVGFSIHYLAAARGRDVIACARVIRRGGSLTTVEVEGTTPDGEAVVRALVTYKLDRDR